jgi:hypothetical protein
MLPYMDSFKYLGMVCDKQINLNTAADAALCPFTAGTFRVKEFVQKHDLSNRLHAYIWLLNTYAIPAGMYSSQFLGHFLLTTRQRNGLSPSEMAVGSVEKDVGGQRHHAFMVCRARVWIGTPTVQ